MSIYNWYLFSFLMLLQEQEFTTKERTSVFCGTWNVNAKKQEGGLHEWLLPANCNIVPDIYCIGFQEIVDLNASNVLLDGSKTAERSKFWQERIEDSLSSRKEKYVLAKSKALVGLLICVYVNEKINPHVRDIRETQYATGLLGMMGNKGGVCIRLSLYDTSICFVCAHLAAHRENVLGRNADYKAIIEGAVFVNNNNLNGGEGKKDDKKAEELIVNDMVSISLYVVSIGSCVCTIRVVMIGCIYSIRLF